MIARGVWRWCVAAGLAAFACSVLFGRIPGLVACGPIRGLGPILAFEFVRSPAEVAALFGTGACRATLVRAQYLGLLLDCLAFIPAYTGFLFLAARGAARAARLSIAPAQMMLTATVFGGLLDEIEGVILWLILRDLPGTQGLVDALWWAVHLKFVWLGIATTAIGAAFVVARRPIGMIAGLVVAAGGLWAIRGLLVDPAAMMAGFTLGWVAILVAAGVGAIRPAWLSAR